MDLSAQRDVAMGLWHKYPNPHSPHIISVDVVDRSIEPDGTLRTERLIAVRQNAPQWIMRVRSVECVGAR